MPRSRSFLLPVVAGVATLVPRPIGDLPGILEFHAVVADAVAHPVAAKDLRVACSWKVRPDETHLGVAGWWSLLVPREPASASGAVIAAFTRAELKRPAEALSTTVRYSPMPTAFVSGKSTLDWAWLWDRNADGRADYLAYLQNAHAILPDPVPADWSPPEVHPDGSVYITRKLLGEAVERAAMVFRHYADDDFDGRVDAAVVEQFDGTYTMFVANHVVVRRSPGAERAGEAWAFRTRITDTLRVLVPDSTGTIRIPAVVRDTARAPMGGGRVPARAGSESADDRLGFGTQALAAVNALVDHCGPAKGRVRTP